MREEKYDISGMHCAACSASVERVTRKLPGVERSEVNLTTGIMTIRYDDSQLGPEQIIAKVEKARLCHVAQGHDGKLAVIAGRHVVCDPFDLLFHDPHHSFKKFFSQTNFLLVSDIIIP